LPLLLATLPLHGHAQEEPAGQTNSNNWLLDAPADQERWRRPETYLGGCSRAMWETGQHSLRLHAALSLENYDLALYHRDKIRSAIEGGTILSVSATPYPPNWVRLSVGCGDACAGQEGRWTGAAWELPEKVEFAPTWGSGAPQPIWLGFIGVAERVGFEPTWGGKAPNRFRVGAVMTASVPLLEGLRERRSSHLIARVIV
jgi:hypothetical protein